MTQRFVLAHKRRGDVLRDHEARVQPAVQREERGQSVGEVRIDETLDPALGDVRELGARHRDSVEPEGERLPVEVAVRNEELVFDEHEWIVGRRIQLDLYRAFDVVEQIARGTVHLGRAAQRVGVLHLVAPPVCLVDRRSLEQAKDVRGRVALSTQWSQAVDLRDEARARSLQRLQ